MESKHTPGPWEIRSDLPYTSHGKVIFHGRFKENRTICRLREGTEEEREANARLIAAAPDLLEALEDLLNMAQTYRTANQSTLSAAEAAIKKAKGE